MAKHAGGRPTKYKKKFVKEIVDWFTDRSKVLYADREKKSKTTDNKFGQSTEKEVYLFPTDFPTFQEYALHIGVDDNTLLDWSKKRDEKGDLRFPEFSYSYSVCKTIQKRCLLINGLNGLYQSNYAGLIIRNFFPDEFKEKQEIDLGGQKENPVKIEDVDSLSKEELDDAITNILHSKKK